MKSLKVLSSLFVASTLISQTGMDVFASLMVLTIVGFIAAQADFRKYCVQHLNPKLLMVILPWFLAVGASLFLGSHPDSALQLLLISFKWVFVLYAIYWGLSQVGLSERVIVPAASLLAFCSAYAIFVYILGRDPINPDYDLAPWAGGHRTGGFLSNAMTFAHVYGVYFCLAGGVAIQSLTKRDRKFYFVLTALLLTGIALVLSFTRGVWIAVFIAGLIMAFMSRPKLGALLSLSGAAVLALLMQVWPALRERLSQVNVAQDERSWIWSAHWNIFQDHPWIGAGYTENVLLVPEYYKALGAPESTIVSHAHNQYLQWLAGTGVIGLVTYAIFIGFFLVMSLKTYFRIQTQDTFRKGLALGLIGAQICFLIGGLTESNFEHSKMKYVMCVIWGLSLSLSNASKSENHQTNPSL